jgi:hypothetical protein
MVLESDPGGLKEQDWEEDFIDAFVPPLVIVDVSMITSLKIHPSIHNIISTK